MTPQRKHEDASVYSYTSSVCIIEPCMVLTVVILKLDYMLCIILHTNKTHRCRHTHAHTHTHVHRSVHKQTHTSAYIHTHIYVHRQAEIHIHIKYTSGRWPTMYPQCATTYNENTSPTPCPVSNDACTLKL